MSERFAVAREHVVLAATLLASVAPAWPQTPARPMPIIVSPHVELDAARQQSFDEQGKAFSAYQNCVTQNERAVRLASLSRDLVEMRDNRQMAEASLAHDASLRTRYPGGYAQIMAAGFEEYKRSGGSAASIDAIRAIPSPCPPPGPALPAARPGVPITKTRSMAVPK